MGRKCRVSLCLIVRDEAHNLAACVGPLAPLVDEIIVVDTGSTDDTRAIAAGLGAQVFDHPWTDSFADARNHALSHATGDYILWVDADDRFDAEQRTELAALLDTLTGDKLVYMMDVVSIQASPIPNSQTFTRHARLFPRLPSIAWEYRVHEQVLPSAQRAGCQLIFTNIRIRHVGYEDATRLAGKAKRDLRLSQLDVQDRPTDPVVLYNLAHGYLRQGDVDQALVYYFQCVKYVRKAQDWVAVMFCELVDVLNSLGRSEEAFSIATQGLVNFPHCGDLCISRARVQLALGDVGGAERDFRAAINAPTGELIASVLPADEVRHQARAGLAHVLCVQGRFAESEALYQRVLSEDPVHAAAWIGLGEVYVRWARYNSAEFVIQQVHKLPNGKVLGNCLRSELLRSCGDHLTAVQLMRETLAESSELEWPWIELVRGLQESQRYEECRDVCEQWLQIDPKNRMARAIIDEFGRRFQATGWSHTALVSFNS
ncbi:MAG: glycosyltransferase [Planctomycetaceae bacterium]|nr:glycosyltransferase [Planctomycetaceae bacterium]